MTTVLTLDQLDLKDKVVLIRVDFNVPLKDGVVLDTTRLVSSIDTIREVLRKGAKKIVLCSHLGRPKGSVNEELRMKPVGEAFSKIINLPVVTLTESVGSDVRKSILNSPDESLVLLENIRFHSEETQGDLEFAKSLSELADVFVLDAFGTAHRAHASVVGVTKFLPSAAGRLLEKEIKNLNHLLESPEKPFVTIVGGAKVSDKVEILESLIKCSDDILIGGAMAYTFLKEQGKQTGNSLVENEKLSVAASLLEKAASHGCRIHLPQDHTCGRELSADTEVIRDVQEILEGFMGLDIGRETIAHYTQVIGAGKTILWNGPMGVFEIEAFCEGTRQVGQAVAESQSFSVVGGGDSVAAAHQFGLADKFTHVSTGGGASLEFLSGRDLPGVKALHHKKEGTV